MIDRFFETCIVSHQWLMSKPCSVLRDEMVKRGALYRNRQSKYQSLIALMVPR